MMVRLTLVGLLLLAACSPQPLAQPLTSAPTSLPAVTQTSVPPTQTPTSLPIPTSLPTATATPVPAALCSPLDELALEELPGILSNPFELPHPGRDDGHHGVDFSFYRYKGRVGMQGLPVQSVLAGRVAGLTLDRAPYGNQVIVETPLEALPTGLVRSLRLDLLPTPAPPDPRLTCPDLSGLEANSPGGQSLYLLYAHLETSPLVSLGDSVSCGQRLGTVGNTGVSSNPHLHLETRLGPAGLTLGSMSHYIANASEAERRSYCFWRVSGAFQLLDPLSLLEAYTSVR